MDKFCYLGDMLSVEGDADAAVEARIRVGWNKFRQLVPLLTNKDSLSLQDVPQIRQQTMKRWIVMPSATLSMALVVSTVLVILAILFLATQLAMYSLPKQLLYLVQ